MIAGLKPDKKRSSLQRIFIQGMEQVMKEGLDFNSLVHETLKDLLGQQASQEFFSSTGAYLPTPEIFSEAANRAFPERTLSLIFNLVVKRAESYITTSTYAGTPQFQMLIRELHSQAGVAPGGRRLALLHDHRAEDELDKLVGHKTT